MRVKTGTVRHRKHKALFEKAKGFRMGRHRLVKSATEAVLHAGEYAYAGRKQKKREFRRLWITRINAAIRPLGLTYGTFIHTLKEQSIDIDRKILAKLALEEPEVFKDLVSQIKK